MYLIIRLAFVLIMGSQVYAFGQEQMDGRCPLRPVSLTAGEEGQKIALNQVQFESDGVASYADVDVKNLASKPIQDVLLLLEFRDAGDASITIPFHAHSTSVKTDGKVPYGLWTSGDPLITEVLPGATQRISAASLIKFVACPVRADLTLVQLRFADGSVFTNTEAWRMQATPRKFPVSLPPQLQLPGSAELVATVEITTEGKVTLQTLQPSTNGLDEALRQIFSSWSFQPALENGKVVRSQQKWLMRFHTETGLPEVESPSALREGAFVRVDLYPVAPDARSNGSVLVKYGGIAY